MRASACRTGFSLSPAAAATAASDTKTSDNVSRNHSLVEDAPHLFCGRCHVIPSGSTATNRAVEVSDDARRQPRLGVRRRSCRFRILSRWIHDRRKACHLAGGGKRASGDSGATTRSSKPRSSSLLPGHGMSAAILPPTQIPPSGRDDMKGQLVEVSNATVCDVFEA